MRGAEGLERCRDSAPHNERADQTGQGGLQGQPGEARFGDVNKVDEVVRDLWRRDGNAVCPRARSDARKRRADSGERAGTGREGPNEDKAEARSTGNCYLVPFCFPEWVGVDGTPVDSSRELYPVACCGRARRVWTDIRTGRRVASPLPDAGYPRPGLAISAANSATSRPERAGGVRVALLRETFRLISDAGFVSATSCAR